MRNRFAAKEKNKVKDRNWKMFAVLLASGEDEYKGEGRKKNISPSQRLYSSNKINRFYGSWKIKGFLLKTSK